MLTGLAPHPLRRGTAGLPASTPHRARHRSEGRPAPAGGRSAGARRRRRDESGGALSLWVVLMVPVSAFAAVVALAGPQRMAAESSMTETAGDLAALVVAYRDGEQVATGPIEGFPPECTSPDTVLVAHCEAMFETMLADLGNLGVDVGSLRGFYSDSFSTAVLQPDQPDPVPCGILRREVVLDAAHVALVADWNSAGWAAAQVWPDGLRMGGESIGRLSVTAGEDTFDPTNPLAPEDCGSSLDVVTAGGVPGWLAPPRRDPGDPDPLASRRLSQQVPGRTAFSG